MIIQSKYLATIKATINGKSKSLFSLTQKKEGKVCGQNIRIKGESDVKGVDGGSQEPNLGEPFRL